MSLTVLEGSQVVRRDDGSRTSGIEDWSKFPPGDWTRLYVPTDRLLDVHAALDTLDDDTARIAVVESVSASRPGSVIVRAKLGDELLVYRCPLDSAPRVGDRVRFAVLVEERDA